MEMLDAFSLFHQTTAAAPGILLLLLALAWWFRRSRPRLAGACFALGLGGLWLMSLPVVVQWSAGALERIPPLARDEWATLGQHADAIVVLGSGRERGDPAWGLTSQPVWASSESVMPRGWPRLRACQY